MSLAVCIITLNEEDNLPRCLDSVKDLAEQVVVVDSASTDRTQELARAAGAEVIERAFSGHVDQKQFALEQARCDWVLCLDADEWLDDDLRRAVQAVIGKTDGPTAEGTADGYEVNRRQRYLGRWIEHGGWSPQWRLRLVRRGRARWTGVDPHDHLRVDGPVQRLDGRLNHVPYRGLAEHLGTINRYTDIMVDRRVQAGESASLFKVVFRPPARFLRMYVVQLGVLDGWRGFVLASFGAFYVFLKYAKLLAHCSAGDQDSSGSR